MNPPFERWQFMTWTASFEMGLVLLAFIVGAFVDVDPLQDFTWSLSALGRGLLATLPMVLLFLGLYCYPLGGFHEVKRFLVEQIGPSLNKCTWYDLIIVALLAGGCEEILFRGLLQQWMSAPDPLLGLAASNLIFALVHFITPTYAISAGVMGLYLGWLLDGTGDTNLLIPITTHAVYDYIAFHFVVRTYRQELALGILVPPEDEDINPDDLLDEIDY